MTDRQQSEEHESLSASKSISETRAKETEPPRSKPSFSPPAFHLIPKKRPSYSIRSPGVQPTNQKIESSSIWSPGVRITIRVKEKGEETMFKIKKSTKMGKVFAAYAKRRGVDRRSLFWFLDGIRISKDQTLSMLELEEDGEVTLFVCLLRNRGVTRTNTTAVNRVTWDPELPDTNPSNSRPRGFRRSKPSKSGRNSGLVSPPIPRFSISVTNSNVLDSRHRSNKYPPYQKVRYVVPFRGWAVIQSQVGCINTFKMQA